MLISISVWPLAMPPLAMPPQAPCALLPVLRTAIAPMWLAAPLCWPAGLVGQTPSPLLLVQAEPPIGPHLFLDKPSFAPPALRLIH